MQIRKLIILLSSILFLLISNVANADFIKSLQAYKVKNGNLVLKEAKNALANKEFDGLALFINSLQLDNVISKSRLFRGDKELEIASAKSQLELMINCESIQKLMQIIEVAVNLSQSLEAKFEYLQLIHGSTFPVLKLSKTSETCMPVSDRRQLVRGMVELAKKGYAKAAFFLFLIKDNLGQIEAVETEQNWRNRVEQNGYKFFTSRALNLYLPHKTEFKQTKPVLSIEKHSNTPIATYADTNYIMDIYRDGSVNFVRGVIADNPRSKNRVVNILSQSELERLIVSIKKLGFDEQPKVQSNIVLKDNMGISPHYGGFAIYRTYIVTLRDEGVEQRLVFKYAQLSEEDGQAFLPRFLNTVEKATKTQFYRCGIESERQYFKQCVDKDL